MALLAAATPARAWSPKLSLRDDIWVQFGLLGQFWYEAKEANAGKLDPVDNERESWSNEVFVRRLRMLAQGAITEWLPFFVSSDSPNLGKHDNDNDVFLNDCIVELKLMPEARILAGRLLSPFSFENLQGAGTLLGVDYNTSAIKLPSYIKAPYRDDGLAVTGVLFDNWLEYRAGMFAGSAHGGQRARNAAGTPRYTGRVMLNLANPQTGWFYFENGLGAKTTMSIGGGLDFQKDGGPGVGQDYQAWVVDAVVDRPVYDWVLSFAFAYYGWRHANSDFTGNTASVQGGWLLWKCLQPVLRWEHQSPDVGNDLDTYHVGLNYYIKGYNLNLKADWAFGDRRDAAGHYEDAARVQLQVLL